ncbi:HPr kinase [Bacillus sp. J14TS2]|uniref:aldolase n=1 Tax=Bacillus sp. J14TS2 TaxID=2807188 RepID=UPI001B13BCFE|nr:aldolase [Bacillus sp. J14TS2]GIN73235.1 HPr kinase [Bacillus sp. J14TS2]
MVITFNPVVYKAFGMHVRSEFPLPELRQIGEQSEEVTISIEIGDLTEVWNNAEGDNRYFKVVENKVLFHIPHTAIYCIQDGNKITVSPLQHAHEDHVRLYILGSCMGALLLQRRVLPLHGSALAINGKAYAIIGDSGAGKSTLASAFLHQGFQLLTDDVIPITFTQQNIPVVSPTYPQQKLWQESLEAFGMGTEGYRPIFQRESKFAIPVSTQFATSPLPLAGIFELVKTNRQQVVMEPILKLQRLQTLFQHTYRNFLLSHLGLKEWHFHLMTRIASCTQLYQIQRPTHSFTADKLTTLILKTIRKESEEKW